MPDDAIIIGGSYAGLSAALQLARARRSVLIVAADRRRNMRARSAHGFLSRDGADPGEIVRIARDQALAYPTVRIMEGEVAAAECGDGCYELTLRDGRRVAGRRLVLAHGIRDELPDIAGVAEKWGRSVIACPYCHGFEARGGRFGVVGSGPVSLHQAALMPDWGLTTLFLQGGPEPDGEQLARLTARDVTIERTPIREMLGAGAALEGVLLQDGRRIPLDVALLATRTHLASPIAQQLGCDLGEGLTGPYIETDDRQRASAPGVFAAGDAAGPIHVISVAAASGHTAGVAAHASLVEAGIGADQGAT